MSDLPSLIDSACQRYLALTPEQKAEHDKAQRESWVRSITEWPKPVFRWVDGAKVYASFADYCND